jgi:hypothetical protein
VKVTSEGWIDAEELAQSLSQDGGGLVTPEEIQEEVVDLFDEHDFAVDEEPQASQAMTISACGSRVEPLSAKQPSGQQKNAKQTSKYTRVSAELPGGRAGKMVTEPTRYMQYEYKRLTQAAVERAENQTGVHRIETAQCVEKHKKMQRVEQAAATAVEFATERRRAVMKVAAASALAAARSAGAAAIRARSYDEVGVVKAGAAATALRAASFARRCTGRPLYPR